MTHAIVGILIFATGFVTGAGVTIGWIVMRVFVENVATGVWR